jgi:hypothetical protein
MASKEVSVDEAYQLNHGDSVSNKIRLGDAIRIVTYTSSAGSGGAATEAMTLTGLAAADTILAVTQKTKGANSLPLLGYTTQAANALTCVWSADPGANAVVVVTVRKASTTD